MLNPRHTIELRITMIKVKVQISVEDPDNSRYVDTSMELEYEKPKNILATLNDDLSDYVDGEVFPEIYKW